MAFLSFSSDEKTDEKGDSLPPSRRQPSPAGKVARAKPVTDEGIQPDGHSNPG